MVSATTVLQPLAAGMVAMLYCTCNVHAVAHTGTVAVAAAKIAKIKGKQTRTSIKEHRTHV